MHLFLAVRSSNSRLDIEGKDGSRMHRLSWPSSRCRKLQIIWRIWESAASPGKAPCALYSRRRALPVLDRRIGGLNLMRPNSIPHSRGRINPFIRDSRPTGQLDTFDFMARATELHCVQIK